MSNGLVSKLKTWVTGDPFEDDIYGEEEEFDYRATSPVRPVAPVEQPVAEPRKEKRNLKVLGHPSAQTAQVVVIEPRAFEEALEIIDHLRSRKAIILNLHLLDNAQSQRVVDFLSGATHAIDGNQQRIGDGVFIFTPSNVVISTDTQAKSDMSLSDAYWNTAHH
ncbi:MAG: cell division protein SepF [Candidatus Melainabacteria bacterium]|nr:cell division protein SepF [Candidatus Melainabacteria bacterium]